MFCLTRHLVDSTRKCDTHPREVPVDWQMLERLYDFLDGRDRLALAVPLTGAAAARTPIAAVQVCICVHREIGLIGNYQT